MASQTTELLAKSYKKTGESQETKKNHHKKRLVVIGEPMKKLLFSKLIASVYLYGPSRLKTKPCGVDAGLLYKTGI